MDVHINPLFRVASFGSSTSTVVVVVVAVLVVVLVVLVIVAGDVILIVGSDGCCLLQGITLHFLEVYHEHRNILSYQCLFCLRYPHRRSL
jgi:hypothetical protein